MSSRSESRYASIILKYQLSIFNFSVSTFFALFGIIASFLLLKFRQQVGDVIGEADWMNKIGGVYNFIIILAIFIFFWSIAELTGTSPHPLRAAQDGDSGAAPGCFTGCILKDNKGCGSVLSSAKRGVIKNDARLRRFIVPARVVGIKISAQPCEARRDKKYRARFSKCIVSCRGRGAVAQW